jgi:hypothetical protein
MKRSRISILKPYIFIFTLLAGALIAGCKAPSEPGVNNTNQEYDSEAAADITASSLGTESGGAGNTLTDVYILSQGEQISGIIDSKSGPMGKDVNYDSTTGLHSVIVNRSGSHGKYSYSDSMTYQYKYFDASGKFMRNYEKGMSDSLWVSYTKARSKDIGERLDDDNSSSGTWTVSNLTSTTPIYNGSFTRTGSVTLHSEKNGDRTMTHTSTIIFANDTLVADADGKHVYLKGSATSTMTASSSNGKTISRDTKITFNGDGTAYLEIKRTNGDGTIDTYTIDVKEGYWKGKGKLK